MKVKFADPLQDYLQLKTEINAKINDVLDSGHYVGGDSVSRFEKNFAEYCEAEHCVGVGNGFDALRAGLLALGVEAGDEVIVPSMTFIATWLAVSSINAKPVPVDCSENTYHMSLEKLESVISPKTKVIIPVHLYGQVENLASINKIAKQYKISVMEDAAQAHGARYKGKTIGAFSDLVAWSFYPAKNLGAIGDGGAITTNNSQLADKIRKLCNYGSVDKYVHEVQGLNSRLDPLQASILDVKLKSLELWNKNRREIAKFYLDELNGLSIVLPSFDVLNSAWHIFPVLLENRNLVQQRLGDYGVQSLIHYPIPPHKQAAYSRENYSEHDLGVTEQYCTNILSLPMGPHFKEEEIIYVVKQLKKIMESPSYK